MTMVRLATYLLGSLIVTSATAQQLDPAVLQRVIGSLQAQRNEAMDKAALAEARAAQLADELQKAKADAIKPKEDKPTVQPPQ